MKLSIENLILGAGYAGLLAQKRLDLLKAQNFIVDMGDAVRLADKDHVIVFREESPYVSQGTKSMETVRYSSNSESFAKEYSKKLYGRDCNLSFPEDTLDVAEVYTADNKMIMSDCRVYGNVKIDRIDIHKKIAYGHVIHLKKRVEIQYGSLISTLPIYEFAKLIGADLFKDYGLFIQFYPTGIIKRQAETFFETIQMSYFSDPLVPFYRRHLHGNTVFYEYCINKEYPGVRFDRVVSPGRFMAPSKEAIKSFRVNMLCHDIMFIGRFALWDPAFLLDHIINNENISEFHEYF